MNDGKAPNDSFYKGEAETMDEMRKKMIPNFLHQVIERL